MKTGSESPILLFGLPRSGTTWIGKIFDSHPDTLYRHEPDSWRRMDSILPIFPVDSMSERNSKVLEYVESIPAIRSPKVCSKLPIFPKRYYGKAGYQLHKSGIIFNKLATRLSPDLPVYGCPTSGNESTRLVWKSIESLGRLAVISKAIPSAHSVHIIRHPCGFAASVLSGEKKLKFSDNKPSGDDMNFFQLLLETSQAKRRRLSLEKLEKLTTEQRLAWKWVLINEKAYEEMSGSKHHQTLIYDNFCKAPLAEIEPIFRNSDLSVTDQTLNFIMESTTDNSDEYYSVRKDPLISANKWKEQLSNEQQEMILEILNQSRLSELFDHA